MPGWAGPWAGKALYLWGTAPSGEQVGRRGRPGWGWRRGRRLWGLTLPRADTCEATSCGGNTCGLNTAPE